MSFLVITFHDLAPHNQELCARFLEDLRAVGIGKVTLLVVPNWYHQEPVEEYPEFLQWLKNLQQEGHEICLHGFCHRSSTVRGGLIPQLIGRFYTASE